MRDPSEATKWQSETAFNDLRPGTAYTFFACCEGDDYYNAATSRAVISTHYPAPGNPVLESAEPGSATARWEAVEDASGYTVQLYKIVGEEDQAVGEPVTVMETSHTFTIAETGNYYFTVQASSEGINGETATSGTVTLSAPEVPVTPPEPEEPKPEPTPEPEPEEEKEAVYIPSAPISDGLHEYSRGTMLYIDGKRVKGLYEYGNATYYFNEQGFMQTETWVELDDGWRYFAADGKMATGWLQIGNAWYYLEPKTGLMLDDGLHTIGKSAYYFHDWGGMASDWWYEAPDGWYFFGGSGAMKAACWLQWKGGWYYLTETGKMATDTDIGGYYVNADGVWAG